MAATDCSCKALLQCYDKLYKTHNYADLTIICGDVKFPVHKLVVCPQSTFLTNACKFGWKESSKNEIVLNDINIDVPAADPKLITHMIYYFYHFDYLTDEGASGNRTYVPPGKRGPEASSPVTHALMYAIADYYDIPGLKKAAERKYDAVVKKCSHHSSFVESIPIVYSMTPDSDRGLRNIVVSTLGESMHLVGGQALNAIVRETKALAFDLLEFNFSTACPNEGSGTRRWHDADDC
ncbi:hypothetical protein NA57DRAFT_50656 [Rhizodiscina lignyota]|uniref:BTB domain-containing protein n=1 Tax=Rhizodiscina lignyota TaxID=1504668 RepID=A0A9P4ISR3_9PEZI|nr:hypothetical protein NA57DRAFT_50656 [Rhizodiscina lignyota]